MRFFKKKAPARETPEIASRNEEDVFAVAQQVESLLDSLVARIFSQYKYELLDQKITFIVPAVWGAVKDGQLTDVQKSIHQEVLAPLNEALSILDFKEISLAQDFAVGYMLRSLIVTKLVYMIEASRRQRAESRLAEELESDPLGGMDTVGSA